MTDQPQNVSIQIDPAWPYAFLWTHPMGERLDITYWDSDAGVADTMSANYADQEVVGRGEQYKHWISTANKEIQLTFQFHVQGSGSAAIRREVIEPARFLDALKSPVYDPSTDLTYAPPIVLLRIGNLLFARCYVSQADIQWLPPFEPRTALAHHADVPTTFTIVRRLSADLSYRRESVTNGRWR